MKGLFGPKGALYSGWETRRHNPTYDWYGLTSICFGGINMICIFTLRCIIQLGTTGMVSGFDIDTANFNGVPTILLHYNQLICFILRQAMRRQKCLCTHCMMQK